MPRSLTNLWGALALATAGLATPAVGAQGALPSSLAHYEITHAGRSERLDIVRTSDRIEHRYTSRGITEVWTRDARGELSHWKVFNQPQRSVHYTAGDLRTIEAEPSWEQLATLINPEERARLKSAGSRRTAHGSASVLEGKVDHQQVRILWNEQSGWAEDLVIGAGNKRKKFRLLSAENCTPATCAPLDTTSVREIEFADLGDSEGDPFVRNFLATFSGHAHSH